MSVNQKKTPAPRVKTKRRPTPRRRTVPEQAAEIPAIPAPEGVPRARYLGEPNIGLRKVLHRVCLDAARLPATDQAKFLGWARKMLAPRLAALPNSPTNTPRGEANTRALMRFVSQEGRTAARDRATDMEFRTRMAEAWIQQVIAHIEWATEQREGGLTTDQMTGVVTAIKALLEQDGLLRLPGGEAQE